MFYRAEWRYPGAAVVWILLSLLQPVVMLAIWTNVEGIGGGAGGARLTAYFSMAFAVNNLSYTWLMWDYGDRIRSGDYALQLLRPGALVGRDVALTLGSKLFSGPVALVGAAVMWVVGRAGLDVRWDQTLFFVVSVAMAIVIRFQVEWGLAQLSFWTTRMNAVNGLYFAVQGLASGSFAPLALLPDWFGTAASLTPFPSMLALPLSLFDDGVSGWVVLGQQGIWVVLTLLVAGALSRRAVARFETVAA